MNPNQYIQLIKSSSVSALPTKRNIQEKSKEAIENLKKWEMDDSSHGGRKSMSNLSRKLAKKWDVKYSYQIQKQAENEQKIGKNYLERIANGEIY